MKPDTVRRITELRHLLHRNAELSGKEYRTKALLMEFLRENTDLEILDRGAWFCAWKKGKHTDADNAGGGKSAVAFRADFDALPIPETIDVPYASCTDGVSHKCGHDGHSAALCGLALELTGRETDRDIWLLFQHAEEIGQGGQVCARFLAEKGIGEVYAFHNLNGFPEGTLVYRRGLTQPASRGLTVTFTGKRSHASAPENGKNPAFAAAGLVLTARELLNRPHRGMLLCTVVQISVGTKDFGISAGEGEVSFTLRAEEEAELDCLDRDLRECAQKSAAAEGLTVSFAVSDPFPETRNTEKGLARVLSAAKKAGIPTLAMPELWRASEDFGWYTKFCDGAMVYLGTGKHAPALHTPEYDFNDQILENAVRLFSALAE